MPSARAIQDEILRQVTKRGAGKTICPSEVARALSDDWRELMPQVRVVAVRMAEAGEITVTQRGTEVDADAARGPIRLRLA